MEPILMGLGGAALLGLNLILWFWFAGIACEFDRERRAPGLVEENVKLHRSVRALEDTIASQTRELDVLHAEGARLKSHMDLCGVRGVGIVRM